LAPRTELESGVRPLERLGNTDVPANDGNSCAAPPGRTGRRAEHIVEVEPAAGASTSVLPGTIAATWASQVGYQNDLISRFA